MHKPLVSVVIVTYNRREDLLESVRSVYGQTYRNFETIVVDNASTDGTVEAVEAEFPDVRIARLGHNGGPTAGRNAGILASRGEILFFLDSDASMAPDTLLQTVHRFDADSSLGVIACKVINPRTNRPAHPGWIFSERDDQDRDTEFLSFSFSECGCAIRKTVFDSTGLFNEFLFFGREGEDLSLRVWDAGMQILFDPKAVVYHRVSPDMRVGGATRAYYDLRNCLYIYLIHYPWWLVVCFAPLRLTAALVRGARRGDLLPLLRAVLDLVRRWPAIWAERRPVSHRTARLYIKLQREHGFLSWDLASWIKYKT